MKSMRRVVGVTAIGGIALGIWLGGLFKGFGLGGNNNTTLIQAPASAPNQPKQTKETGSGLAGGTTKQPVTKTAVEVLVDNEEYFLRDGDLRKPISLEALVKQVSEADADSDGFRVKVYRTDNSRVLTESILVEELRKAGVVSTSIYLHPQTVLVQ